MEPRTLTTWGQVRIRITGDRASVGSVAAAISDTVTHMSQPYPNRDRGRRISTTRASELLRQLKTAA